MLARIDSIVAELGDTPARNFGRWPVRGVYVPVNHAPYSKTFEAKISRLKAWLTDRAA
jgi:hypothetical protein